ncbi:MAG: hypothetical protein WCV84_03725 [Patescibacteria group bacterium]
MKTLTVVGLVGLVAVKAAASVPRLIANSVGLGFENKFTIGEKTIKRPDHFNTKAHKAAFENVGYYVTDALTRDVMIAYRDIDLATDCFLRPSGVPLAVWHEVLECFEEQGFIERRWELSLTCTLDMPSTHSTHTYRNAVSWGPKGEDLERPKGDIIGGTVPDSVPFVPSLLTEGQKQALLGTQYALHPTTSLAWQKIEQKYVTLTAEDFARVYWRPRSLFSATEKHDAVEKVAKMVMLSHS